MGQSAELAEMKIDSAIARAGRQDRHEGNQRGAHHGDGPQRRDATTAKPLGKRPASGAEKSTLNQQLNSETQNIRATTALISADAPTRPGDEQRAEEKDIRNRSTVTGFDIEQSKGEETDSEAAQSSDGGRPAKAEKMPSAKASRGIGKADAMPAKVLTWNHKTGPI